MRRVFCLALCTVPLAGLFGGCGSSSGSANPLATELSYFPPGSPLVLSVATDPNSGAVKSAEALVGRFPLATFGETALMGKIDQLGIDYQSDIRPLFGNPIMVGATNSLLTSGSAGANYLFVWMTKDAGKLKALIKKLGGGRMIGSHRGASLYQAGTSVVAADGPTALFGSSTASVDSAIDRHANGSGIASADYSRAFTGLPQNALIQTFGNLTAVLSQPSAAKARRVPWVAALRGYAATVSATSSGLTFSYRLDTTGTSLTSAQVPFATASAPNFAGTMPITAGIQDPAHIVQFAEQAARSADPAGYAKFLVRQANARKKTGVDLNALLSLVTGSLIVASDTRTTEARVSVSNPSAVARDLSKLAGVPQDLFNKRTRVTRLGGGFFAIHETGATTTVGVVGNQLLAGKATPAQLRAFAASPATPAPGAQGGVAFRVALVDLLRLGLKQSPPQIVQSILSSLGDITGWVSSNPSGIIGSATLAVR